jgi:hypothetical protein
MSKLIEALTRAIAREGTNTGYWKKNKFWTGEDNPPFSGGEDPTPDIQDLLNQLTAGDLSDPETRALAAAAGNFVWGRPTYQLPESDKNRILQKVRNGQPLSDAENLFYTTYLVDTDMF